ncbi:MAG TPA: cyclic nucleotide-binding and patatin-like phospholipase domain-containing protein [Anaerolineaceae bacterium]|nr:cyclic nucleotide-binding and patatin-like phospholipase domain-containing protein [Anaerolineaceae bacterium]
MDPMEFISRLPIFCQLEPGMARVLADKMQPHTLNAGQILSSQDSQAAGLVLVISGRLRSCVVHPDGSETKTGTLGPGDCTGEMSLLTGESQAFTLVAEEDAQLLTLTRQGFAELGASRADLVNELACALLPRVRQTQARLALTRVFGPMDPDAMEELLSHLEWRRLTSAQVLCRQGEPGDEMYIVVQGRLRFAAEEAGQWNDLGEVGAGETVGEFALLTERGSPESQRSATIYATRLTDIIVISRQVFEDLLCRFSQSLLRLTRQIIQRELMVSKAASKPVGAQVIAVVPLPTGMSRLGVAPTGMAMTEFSAQLAETMAGLGSTFFLDAARFDASYGRPGASGTPIDHPTSLLLDTWLDEHERRHQYALYDTGPSLDQEGNLTAWARRCVEDADFILLVADGSADAGISPLEVALLTAHTRARVELVLLHDPGCVVPQGTVKWLDKRLAGDLPVRGHHHVRRGNPADLRRLCRRISGRPVALTLSGGGARGWAHIGVLQALAERGLEVDWVGGASMGAIIAGGYALDWSPTKLRQLAEKFSDPRKLLDYTLPYTAITATRRITTLMQDLCGEAMIEDAWRPYFCVSANLSRGEEQSHTHGLIWQAMRSSMAFPGVFAPILDQGCVLIDGGAANNMPVDRMREFCPTGTVIGVDLLTSSPVRGQYQFGPSLSGWQALFSRLNPFGGRIKAPHLLNIVDGIVYSNNRYRLNETAHCADIIIRVPVEKFGLLEFEHYEQIIEVGYTAARQQLEELFP